MFDLPQHNLHKVGVINYGSSNYKSFCNALDFLKIERIEILKPGDFADVDHIVLPGVGTYASCMNRLQSMGIVEPLKGELLENGKLFLGIWVNVHYIPVHTQPYYRKLGFKEGDYPEAERYYRETISLPIFAALTEAQRSTVIETIEGLLR